MIYDSVLFDFDGVLVDSEPIHYQCWREVLAPFGVDLDWATYERTCIGVADRPMVAALCRTISPPADFERVWAEYPRKNALYRARVAAAPPIAPAVVDLLGALDGLKLAVVSSSHRGEVEPLLVAAGVRDRFGAVVCGDDVARHKPDPEPYRTAAALLGARAPLVVEDSPAGVASGRAAGFDVLEIRSAAETPARVREALGMTR
jgi:beta-phosphoglucomutase